MLEFIEILQSHFKLRVEVTVETYNKKMKKNYRP